MSTDAATISLEEFLSLPDNGMDRYVHRGELREFPMTVRNRWHSYLQIEIGSLLREWSRRQPAPHGRVYGGEVGCILRKDPATVYGIDVAYFSPQSVAQVPRNCVYMNSPPVLAVEILSPSDVHENVVEKIREYLACGVAVVWIVDPDLQHITAYRSQRTPQQFTMDDELVGDPELPGLRFSVADVFRD
jgi:Uma2 family endonuclease